MSRHGEIDNDLNQTLRAVQDAIANVVELVEQASAGVNGPESELINALREEVHETLFGLIAGVLATNRQFTDVRQTFFRLLISAHYQGECGVRPLDEFAERWHNGRRQAPEFFRVALRYDAGAANEIMREIQIAAHNASVCDRQFATAEHRVVQNYIAMLERHAEYWNAGQETPPAD
jgi:hypothetical protein